MKAAFLHRLVLVFAFAAMVGSDVSGEDWPRYLGPRFDLTSSETNWISDWPDSGPQQLWKTSLGPGASSVTISNGRLYTMGNVNDKDVVYCLDANTGKALWRYSYACPLGKRSFEGGPAATPTVDAERVYTMSYEGDFICLNTETGNVIWQKQVRTDLGGQKPQWGYAGSALVRGDLVILDIGGADNSTVALHKLTGHLVWKAGNDQAGYSSPVPFTLKDRRAVLLFKARHLVALDEADGKELWRYEWKTSWNVNAPSPLVLGDKIFLTSGYKVGCALFHVRNGRPVVLWKNNALASQISTPVISNDHVYGIHGDVGKGTLKCVSLETGEVRWEQPDLGNGSLLLAGNRLIILSEKGELIVCRASPDKFEALARAKILHDRCWVVPVLANGKLYCRSNSGTLVCLDLSH